MLIKTKFSSSKFVFNFQNKQFVRNFIIQFQVLNIGTQTSEFLTKK